MQYTNINQWGQYIYERGLDDNNEDYQKKTKFKPTLYTNTHNSSKYKSLITNENLIPRTFDCIRDARDWINDEKDTEGKSIHGMDTFLIQYIEEQFPGEIEMDLSKIRIYNLDIEVNSSNIEGFPHPKDAQSPITAITLYDGKEYHTWGFNQWHDRG